MINFPCVKYFKKEEFYHQENLIEPIMIYNLDRLREVLKQRIYISPAIGAIARHSGSKLSQHYVGPSPKKIVRKSTAIDIFIEGIPFNNFLKIHRSNLFTGIGVYLDTTGVDGKPWVMFHLDLRSLIKDTPLIWIAYKEGGTGKTIYSYPVNDPYCLKLLQRDIFYENKIKA